MGKRKLLKKSIALCMLVTGMLWGSYLYDGNSIQVEAAVKNGFVTEDGYTYYYKNGVKQKGFQNISGSKYLFDTTGKMQKGWQNYNNYTYYFSTKTGKALGGLYTIDGEKYYFHPTYKTLQKGKTITVNGKAYYLSKSDGKVLNGIVKMYKKDGGYYYKYFDITSSTGYARSGIVLNPNNNSKYFVDTSGTILFGMQREPSTNKLYLFDKTTLKMRTGWQKYNGYTYYFDPETGEALSGLQTINGKKYYFSDKNVVQKMRRVTVDGKAYYCNSYGIIVNGIIKHKNSEGKYYYVYYDNRTDTGFPDIGGKSIGIVRTAATAYCVNNQGVLMSGIQTVDGKKYIFDADTKKMLTGWQNRVGSDGKTVTSYFEPETGAMLTGWQVIDGKTYWLYGEWGVLQKTGAVAEDSETGKHYFLSADTGEALTGVYPMGDQGYKYYFDPSEATGIVTDLGLQTRNGQLYYFETSSTPYPFVYEGLKYVHDDSAKEDGTVGVYYFDLENGAARKNASETVGYTTFNFDAQGKATWTNTCADKRIEKMFNFGLNQLGKAYIPIVPGTKEEGENQLLTMETYVCNTFVAACYRAGYGTFDMYESGVEYSLTPPKQAQKCKAEGSYFYKLSDLKVGNFVFFNDESCEGEGRCDYIVDIDGYRTNIHHIAIYMGKDAKYYYCLDASESENSVRIYNIPKEKMESIQWTADKSEQLAGQFYVTAFGKLE